MWGQKGKKKNIHAYRTRSPLLLQNIKIYKIKINIQTITKITQNKYLSKTKIAWMVECNNLIPAHPLKPFYV